MALSPTDCFNEPAYAPEYPASVAFVLRKMRQLRAEIGSELDSVVYEHEALKARVAALEARDYPVIDRGNATVAQLNALVAKNRNWMFHLTSSGTLTVGNVQVSNGDTVIWNGEAWAVIRTNGLPSFAEVDIPGRSTTLNELKVIVKDMLEVLGRTEE